MPIPTGSWRGLGLMANIFRHRELCRRTCFRGRRRSSAFRLAHLPRRCSWTAHAAPSWKRRRREPVGEKPQPQGRVQGIACSSDGGTVVVEVAQISLDRDSGRIQVHRVVAAVDAGRTINPDGARAQIESCIVMGTSAALMEEITVKNGRVQAGNFDRYPLIRMAEAPEVETILLEAPDGRPRGLGEPPIGPIAPAIGNALFALTGVRLRRLPMTPERVKAALES